MKVESTPLLHAVQYATSATGKQRHIPVYGCVRLETTSEGVLKVSATDGDLSIVAEVECEGTLEPAIVPPDVLARFLKSVGGAGTLEVKENALHLAFGDAALKLASLPVEDWPSVAIAQGETVVLDAKVRRQLEGILYAASKDEARPILTGIGFGHGWAAATDSYRLAAVRTGVLTDCIVPARVFALVFKHAASNITLTFDSRRLSIHTHRGITTTRLLEGAFPDWQKLVPATATPTLTVDRKGLLDALERVSVVSGKEHRPVRITKEGDALSLRVLGERGDTAAKLPAEGELSGELGFNAGYLGDIAKAFDTDTLVLGLEGINKPAVAGSMDSGNVHLLMPVRV